MSDEIANLTALVKELRAKSGVGILDCKKALVESGGDLEKAYDLLRAKGEKLARSKAERSATEGKVVYIKGQHDIAMVVVNCETDFVSKGDDFQNFAQNLAKIAYENKTNSVEALASKSMGEGSVESERVALISKIGENIQISAVYYHNDPKGFVGVYSHSDKLMCAVFLSRDDESVAKDIGMHVVAMNPVSITSKDVPLEIMEREKALFATQTEKMGKPEFAEKIIQGKMAKFLKEVCLLDQDFVKETTMTVKDYLNKSKAEVLHFIRVELG